MAKPTNNQRGQRFLEPKGPGEFIGKTWRTRVTQLLNCFYGLDYRVKTRGADGTSTIISKANVSLAPLGGVVELDLTNISGLGGSGGSRYFKGTGAPSASTLSAAFTYISTTSMSSPAGPDFYWDITDALNPNMWVCVTAGTNSTSAWICLTCC